jgi:hypothetical protein
MVKLWEGDEKGTTFEFSTTIQNFSLRAEFWIVESQIKGRWESFKVWLSCWNSLWFMMLIILTRMKLWTLPPNDSSTYLINLFIWEIQLRHFNEGDKGKAIESSMIQNFTSEFESVLNSPESEFWIIDNSTNNQMIC